MLFRMESEFPPTIQIRLKIEINCFEHFNELGLVKIPFIVENSWFTGECEITTYRLNELLGTKLRALYQRKKGRDLFDLYVALTKAEVDVNELMRCYHRYMSFAVQQPHTNNSLPIWKKRWLIRIFWVILNCFFVQMSLLTLLKAIKLLKNG